MAADRCSGEDVARSSAIGASVSDDEQGYVSVCLPRKSRGESGVRTQKVEVPLEGLGIVLSIPMELFGKHAVLDRALQPKEIANRYGVVSRPSEIKAAPFKKTEAALSPSRPESIRHDVLGDPIVEHLLRAGREAEELGEEVGAIYADAVRLALVAKLLGNADGNGQRRSNGTQKAPLPEWRLKRVVEHVSANYARTITLSDLSAAAGLSRMHFAAQFRQATGLRPREFVLRRRVEAAQEMLLGTQTSLVEVALSVGFQTQAHFTTVFKRFVGETPNRWRSIRRSETALQASMSKLCG